MEYLFGLIGVSFVIFVALVWVTNLIDPDYFNEYRR